MPMHPLGQLITDRMTHPDNRWSLQDVVDRIEAAGHSISKSRLGQIRNDPVESIKGDLIIALADGLGVTPLTVANAALASMGIEPRPGEVTDSVATIRTDPTLSDANRKLLVAMIKQMRAEHGITASPLRVVARNTDESPDSYLPKAARKTDPRSGKGRSEQGTAPDGGA